MRGGGCRQKRLYVVHHAGLEQINVPGQTIIAANGATIAFGHHMTSLVVYGIDGTEEMRHPATVNGTNDTTKKNNIL
jgi:hypothetical protein